MKEHLDVLKQLTSWLGVVAAATSLIVVYLVFVADAPSLDGGAKLLQAARCPDGSPDRARRVHFDTSDYDIFYRDTGCNAVDPKLSISTADALKQAEERLRSLRLPRLRRPVAVDILSGQPEGGVQVIHHPGAAGAIVINGSSGVYSYLLDRSVAELMLAMAAPGLDPETRRELAAGYAIASSPDAESRRQALSAASDEGRFYGYLLASYGPDLFPEALSGCRERCSLEHGLDRALRKRNTSLEAQRVAFSA